MPTDVSSMLGLWRLVPAATKPRALHEFFLIRGKIRLWQYDAGHRGRIQHHSGRID